jgi:hypothetical protein
LYRETTAVWVSLNVPCGQPPGLYEGEIFITAVKTEAKYVFSCCFYLFLLEIVVSFRLTEDIRNSSFLYTYSKEIKNSSFL